jgi:predicted molibdopterin-dependent oxidoreductase YjgC
VFTRIGVGEEITFELDGEIQRGRAGDSIAAAVLCCGETEFRRASVSGALRGPYCMMGACFECMVEVDGVANQQACMVPLSDGMKIRRMAVFG